MVPKKYNDSALAVSKILVKNQLLKIIIITMEINMVGKRESRGLKLFDKYKHYR
jgi:hypothetical protein